MYFINMKNKKLILDIFNKFHKPEYLEIDPLLVVHRFSGKSNIEIIGLLAASLAYGRVDIIIRSIEKVLFISDNNLKEFSLNTSYIQKKRKLANFKHRFNDGEDIALLLETIKLIYKEFGSIEKLFYYSFSKSDGKMKSSMENFCSVFLNTAKKIYGSDKKSFAYFFPKPSKGSGCKRLNMYFRWMIRKSDGIDFGIWKKADPSILIIPVDVHVARVGKLFNLTDRKNSDWKTAEEITDSLRKLDPSDPVKFDFSLCRFGMVEM